MLDGQQRLASIRDFLHNRFSVDGRVTPKDEDIHQLHGNYYKDLPTYVRRRVDLYPLRCFRISDYRPEEPSELFYRLNQPTMLTAGEQRNALFGPAREQLKRLVQDFEDSGNSKDSLGFSNIRLAYDDVLARLLFFLELGSFGSKSTETRISERFRTHEGFSAEVINRALFAIQTFSQARNASPKYRFNKASTLSWLLFFSRFARRPDDSLAELIAHFIAISTHKSNFHYIYDAVLLFEDRSSLKVTDVSSVVYRDFALCHIYYFTLNSLPSEKMNRAVFHNVEEMIADRVDTSFEDAVEAMVNVGAWSETL